MMQVVSRWLALSIVIVSISTIARGGPVTRDGVTWNAHASAVQIEHGQAVAWTVEARSTGKHDVSLPCVWFHLAEDLGHLERGKLVVDVESVRRAPGIGGCADGTPATLHGKDTWKTSIDAGLHGDPGTAVRVQLTAMIGEPAHEKEVPLAEVMLVVDADGHTKLETKR